MISALRQRLAREESGFTLIELLVVIIIIGILLAIAVPSYLGFRDRANNAKSQANVRSAIPSVEAFYADNGTYAGMTIADLRTNYDAGLSPDLEIPASVTPTATYYCLQTDATPGPQHYYQIGGASGTNGAVTAGACP
jgi:type IV pilus assembly protein PilA